MDAADKYALLGTLKNSGLDLVAYVVERDFQNAMQNMDKDDLVGCGILGLLKASGKYDASRGVSFVTFACKNVKRAILSFIRQKCQRKYRYLEEIDVETPRRGVCTDGIEYDDEDEKAYMRRMVDNLPEPHRMFARKYYLQEMSVKEFQKASAMKRHRIFQLRTQTLALLRVKMAHG